jgi:hypothetical protein
LFRRVLLSSAILALAKQSIAVNANYALEAGVNHSDNIRQTETNQLKDTVALLRGELNVTDESSTNDFVLGVNLEYLDYKDDTFEDQTNANLNLVSNWGLIENALTWDINGYYGQQAIDAFAVATPDNLQDTGFLSTGPNVIIHFTDLDSLTLGYRYNDFYAEQTLADYRSDLFKIALIRRLSDSVSLSLNSSYEDLSYDFAGNNDFSDLRYSIKLSRDSVATQYSLEAGNIIINFEDDTEIKNKLLRGTLRRQINTNNSISIDLSETVDNGAAAVEGSAIPTFVTNDLFVNQAAQLTYNYSRTDFQFSLGYTYSDQDYVDPASLLDQKVKGGIFDIAYGRPSNINYRLHIFKLDTDFYVTGQQNTETTITLTAEKRLSRNLNLIGSYENFVRESNVQAQDIEENTVMLSLRYQSRI